jgi:GTP cyclohydrolase II
MAMIANTGAGVVLYMRQEGRGIGLLDKLRAYNLQDQGYDTVDANLMLGHEADERDYSLAALILEDLGVASVRLITNNPAKINALEAAGISVAERVPLTVAANSDNAGYLLTKAQRMDHLLPIKAVSKSVSS